MRIFTLLAWGAIALSAQGTVHTQDRLVSDSPVDDLYVEADGAGRVPVESNGTFVLDLPKNNSLVALRIVNRFGDVVQSTFISPIQGGVIEVPFAPLSKTVLPGQPISARRLAVRPSKGHRRLLHKADALLRDGQAAESVAALESIVLTTPGWFEAWNNLGARQYALGRFESAVQSFQSALRLDPNAAQDHTNLGLALIHVGRHEESARHATRAGNWSRHPPRPRMYWR